MTEFDEVKKIFKQKKINSWINCPRRLHPRYVEVRKLINKNELIKMSVKGGDWNFSSNLIHFIDLFCFFTGNNLLQLKHSILGKIVKSKRIGYYNFDGKISILDNKKNLLKKDHPLTIKINSKTFDILINETNGFMIFKSKKKNVITKKVLITNSNVSDLSVKFIDSILNTGRSKLVNQNISYKHHKVFLNVFLKHFNEKNSFKSKISPIT